MSYLIVDKSPLFQERMYSHDGADIASQVPSTRRDCEILDGIQAVGVDHKITVVLVDGRCFASVSTVEEFGQGFLFQRVYGLHVKPCAVTWKDDLMGLSDQVRVCSGFERRLCLCGLTVCRICRGGCFLRIFYDILLGIPVLDFGILFDSSHFRIFQLGFWLILGGR